MRMIIGMIGSIGLIFFLIWMIILMLKNKPIIKVGIGLLSCIVLTLTGFFTTLHSDSRVDNEISERRIEYVEKNEIPANEPKEESETKEQSENEGKNIKIIETDAINRSIAEIIQLYDGKTAAYDVLNDKHLIVTAYVKDTHIGNSGPYIYIDAKNMKSFLGSKVEFRPSVTSEAVSELSEGQKIVLDGIGYTKGPVFELHYATILSVDDQEIDENNMEIPDITYKQVDFKTMTNDLKQNAFRAEETYQNEYIQITCQIENIDSDGKYISVVSVGNTELFPTHVQCFIKTDAQRNVIMYKNKGDAVTIKGKVTMIGEIIGYLIDIDEII